MSLDQKIETMLADVAKTALEHAPFSITLNCESPIEELFATTMWARGCWAGLVELYDNAPLANLIDNIKQGYEVKNSFCAQVEVAGFRVDFVMVSPMSGQDEPLVIVIECDGHDFHEKNKEQVRRDKSRERKIVAAGCKVLRFSGSEIWRDPIGCVDAVLTLANREYNASWRRHSSQIIKDFGSIGAYVDFCGRKNEGATQ